MYQDLMLTIANSYDYTKSSYILCLKVNIEFYRFHVYIIKLDQSFLKEQYKKSYTVGVHKNSLLPSKGIEVVIQVTHCVVRDEVVCFSSI